MSGGARGKLTIGLQPLFELAAKLKDPQLMNDLHSLSSDRDLQAIVAQAVAENFDKEGPGWAPLHKQTLKRSYKIRKLKKLKPAQLKRREELVRRERNDSEEAELQAINDSAGVAPDAANRNDPGRAILQRSGLLKKSASTIGAAGNICEAKKDKLTWGTDLKYARIHNRGGTINHPGTNNGFGKARMVGRGKNRRKVGGVKIPPHSITIPQREFLFLSQERWEELNEYAVARAFKLIREKLKLV